MKAKRIVFPAPNEVTLEGFDFDPDALAPNEVAIRTCYSLVSPGTELACMAGTESWAKLPFTPGYAACGEVIAVGGDVRDFEPGDVVLSYTKHASHVKAAGMIARVPSGLDRKFVPFARMAAVSITALRVSGAELGDHVAVLGLGLVGNLCAQLMMLAGCDVIGVDLSPRRLDVAGRCGVKHLVDASSQDVKAEVDRITGGRMCEVVVEATGAPAVAQSAPELAGKLGEVILLGSPRGEHQADVTELLNYVHLWPKGCVTLKGAHEWRYPRVRDNAGYVKHSIERNLEILLRLIAEERLKVRELLTHLLPPSECVRAYDGLRNKKDEFLGVVFDWTQAP